MDWGSFLTHPFAVAIVVPIILLLLGSFARKLARASAWEARDFYLGVEFTLAAMSSALLHLFDLAQQLKSAAAPGLVGNSLVKTGVFLVVTFIMLLFVMSVHQDWEKRTDGQFLRLGILGNVIGCGLVCAFVLLVKGI